MRTKLFIFSSVLILALALSACGPSTGSQNTLNVTGTGTVYLTPDIAYINIGVHTENADIAQAVASNNAQTQAVVDALRANGVDGKDIQTSNFSVWSYQTSDPMTGEYTGMMYSVDNSVAVTVRDLTKLGNLLNIVVGAGANNINGISFDVTDKTAALAEARQKAMENAGSLANELAQTAGVSLGGIQNISYADYSTPYYGYGYGMGGGGGAESAAAPINPGQLQVTATVNVTYGIK
ncbi:MAG: hypothetical protein FD146_396 [Anaerolineaceae bacterium]|nr:MAG: hypothetical protein FD146_396 [Anaerolineaceae bacterium]